MSESATALPGAGNLSLLDILSTFSNGAVGSDVHPLVLEAVVQIVLAQTDEEVSHSTDAPQTFHAVIPSLPAALPLCATPDPPVPSQPTRAMPATPSRAHKENPYWHLTQLSPPGDK
ncbi:hypothetical protein DXG01_002650 [Tephrocybe rancida]|nr:hypothetical protein DXG01_002650 [Tephrocybe rancida]